MNPTVIIIMFTGLMGNAQPMNPSTEYGVTGQVDPEPIIENICLDLKTNKIEINYKKPTLPEFNPEYCCNCYEEIPEKHGRFVNDEDHLVCTHCYFYTIPVTRTTSLEYVSKCDYSFNYIADSTDSEDQSC